MTLLGTFTVERETVSARICATMTCRMTILSKALKCYMRTASFLLDSALGAFVYYFLLLFSSFLLSLSLSLSLCTSLIQYYHCECVIDRIVCRKSNSLTFVFSNVYQMRRNFTFAKAATCFKHCIQCFLIFNLKYSLINN